MVLNVKIIQFVVYKGIFVHFFNVFRYFILVPIIPRYRVLIRYYIMNLVLDLYVIFVGCRLLRYFLGASGGLKMANSLRCNLNSQLLLTLVLLFVHHFW